MVDGESEIDDARFFLSQNGKTNAKNELHATINALLNETKFDDNSTACLFPARKAWLVEHLDIQNLPKVTCQDYDDILKRLNPKSATLVFPSAHINSPASMFGHTFLRINSAYNSKLLSYAINYAADADPKKENGMLFAVKGLFGGYYGKYSLLPYYEKLKEYRDTEQRDIWEYDLDLNEEETLKMVRHVWELNGTHSNYYFFTENCSYNMLWFIELARPSIHLREYFNYQVIPLETVHASSLEGIITNTNFRPSKRAKLLRYEELINPQYSHMPRDIVEGLLKPKDISNEIELQQRQYILEAALEFLEYSYSKNDMKKEEYLKLFHLLSSSRATLKIGKEIEVKKPNDPLKGHRALRVSGGFGFRDDEAIGFLGIRPAYHDLEDSNYGFLRGTQIEFLDALVSYSNDEVEVEKATILSIVSLAQRTEFFESLSWRTKFGWDKDSLENDAIFNATLGAGFSWGNELAYVYTLIDPFVYVSDELVSGVGGSVGLNIDKYDFMATNLEATSRYYDIGKQQYLLKASQSFRTSKNTQLKLKYEYKDKLKKDIKDDEQTYKVVFNYYF